MAIIAPPPPIPDPDNSGKRLQANKMKMKQGNLVPIYFDGVSSLSLEAECDCHGTKTYYTERCDPNEFSDNSFRIHFQCEEQRSITKHVVLYVNSQSLVLSTRFASSPSKGPSECFEFYRIT
jgi:hypothetical protein